MTRALTASLLLVAACGGTRCELVSSQVDEASLARAYAALRVPIFVASSGAYTCGCHPDARPAATASSGGESVATSADLSSRAEPTATSADLSSRAEPTATSADLSSRAEPTATSADLSERGASGGEGPLECSMSGCGMQLSGAVAVYDGHAITPLAGACWSPR